MTDRIPSEFMNRLSRLAGKILRRAYGKQTLNGFGFALLVFEAEQNEEGIIVGRPLLVSRQPPPLVYDLMRRMIEQYDAEGHDDEMTGIPIREASLQ